MRKIKLSDQVEVIAGKDKGKERLLRDAEAMVKKQITEDLDKKVYEREHGWGLFCSIMKKVGK